jgi:DNA-binding GntR family transcriptional regulator
MYDMAAESFPSAFHIEQYLVDHDRIVAAIERRDAAQAVAAMRAHLRNVGDNLLGAAQLAPSP